MISFLAVVLAGYALLVGVVFVAQRALLYFPSRAMPDPARASVPGLTVVTTETTDGLTLTHWYRPPAAADGAVVVFHGNGGSIAHRVPKFAAFAAEGFGVFFAEYRGYGGNPGRPTEEGLYRDARSVLAWLDGEGVGPSRLALYGESLGAAVAVRMAAEHPVAALVLESPFTSVAELAQHHYWYLPARWLVLDRFAVLPHLRRVEAPLLVVHGAEDAVVPPRYGKRVFAAANEPKEMEIFPRADHNDLSLHGVVERAVRFLHRVFDQRKGTTEAKE